MAQGVVHMAPLAPPYSLLSPEPLCQCVNQSAPCPPLLVSPFSIEWVVVHPWPSRCTQCASPTKEFGLDPHRGCLLPRAASTSTVEQPPKQGTGFCCSFPAATSGRSPKHFRKAQVGQPNLSKLWMQGLQQRRGGGGFWWCKGQQCIAMQLLRCLNQAEPTSAALKDKTKSDDCLSALLQQRHLQPINSNDGWNC